MTDLTEPTIPTATPVPTSQEPMVTPHPGLEKNRTWLFLGIVFGIMFLITIIAVTTTILVLNNRSAPPPVPPSAATIVPVPIPVVPTKYSTDSAILQLRANLKLLMAKTDTLDLVEPEIAPPILESNLKIPPLP